MYKSHLVSHGKASYTINLGNNCAMPAAQAAATKVLQIVLDLTTLRAAQRA
jgi:hypothetical protein